MAKRNVINLSKAVFKGRAYFELFSLVLCALFLTMCISVFLPGGPDQTFMYVLFLVGIPSLYLMISLVYYKFWLLEDRIVLKYPFRFRNQYRTMLLSDIDRIAYMNKIAQSGLASIVIIHAKPMPPGRNMNWASMIAGIEMCSYF